jgi:hypothetical protein
VDNGLEVYFFLFWHCVSSHRLIHKFCL